VRDEAIAVLVVCGPTSPFNERLPVILPETEYAIRITPDTDSGGALAQETPFDLIVFEHPAAGSGIHEFLKALRWSGSPCHGAAIVILTPPDLLEEAEEMLVAGIGRILNLYAPDAFLARAIGETLDPDRRLPIKALVRIPGEDVGLRGTLMIQTENLSVSGMMMRCDKPVPIGARFSFALELPGLTGPVQGSASVVRFAKSGSERITGFAARFLSFDGDGEERVQSFIERETARQKSRAKTPG
jgi:hypothetical protein